MSTEPPPPVNPYAPSDALAHDEARGGAPGQPIPRRLTRALAIIVTLVSYPVPGIGLYVLGRRFLAWMAASALFYALGIVAVFLSAPRMAFAVVAVRLLVGLVAFVHTIVARPGNAPPPHRRALLVCLLLVAGSWGASLAGKRWLADSYLIPSGGMLPTLFVGDYIMVAKTKRIAPGDVIVFRYPLDRKVTYMKRVVAVGGQTIGVNEGVVSVDGVALEQVTVGDCPPTDDEGLPNKRIPNVETCKVLQENAGKGWYSIMRYPAWSPPGRRYVVPPGHVFVLGDNRDNSSDSRVWGPVAHDLVEGRAAFVWWSRDPRGTIHWDRIGKKID